MNGRAILLLEIKSYFIGVFLTQLENQSLIGRSSPNISSGSGLLLSMALLLVMVRKLLRFKITFHIGGSILLAHKKVLL